MPDPWLAPAITITDLRKSFGGHPVLAGINLHVPAASVFSLLGPNGAGKSTLVNIMSTLVPADSGQVRIAGHSVAAEPDAVRATIGVTGQFSAVDPLLTGEENLVLMGDLRHLPREETRQRTAEMLERFDLTGAATRRAGTYSGGMTRRLDLAMSLIGAPRILFLDEPTTGLDPRSRRSMWRAIRDLAEDGVTIFLTTQYLDEADQLADRIAVLDRGTIVAEGTPAELKRLVPGGHIVVQLSNASSLEAATRVLDDAVADRDALTVAVPTTGGVTSLRGLLDRLDGEAISVESLAIHTPDLDDVFFALTGHAGAAG